MKQLASYETDDLKLIYRVLHANLLENLQLMDSEFFTELQSFLQTLATLEGVDVSDHGAWDAWLERPHAGCENTVAQRRELHA